VLPFCFCKICIFQLSMLLPLEYIIFDGTHILYQIQSDNFLSSCMTIQCENGHIACSSCCIKLSNKCPSCFWPIGYIRCRAIEKVLEVVKIPCQNSSMGAKKWLLTVEKVTMRRHAYMHLVHARFHIANSLIHLSSYICISAANIVKKKN
jgi:hypothetical protein